MHTHGRVVLGVAWEMTNIIRKVEVQSRVGRYDLARSVQKTNALAIIVRKKYALTRCVWKAFALTLADRKAHAVACVVRTPHALTLVDR